MQRVFEVIGESDGAEIFRLVADADLGGASEFHVIQQWNNPNILDRISAVCSEAATWLRDNGVS